MREGGRVRAAPRGAAGSCEAGDACLCRAGEYPAGQVGGPGPCSVGSCEDGDADLSGTARRPPVSARA